MEGKRGRDEEADLLLLVSDDADELRQQQQRRNDVTAGAGSGSSAGPGAAAATGQPPSKLRRLEMSRLMRFQRVQSQLNELLDTLGEPLAPLNEAQIEHYRDLQQIKGSRRWMQDMLDTKMPAFQILQVFGMTNGLEPNASAEDFMRVLPRFFRLAQTFLMNRSRLMDVQTLDDVIHLLRTRKKIMVLTGAGVSVSCGIPDFRSRDGVYRRLRDEFGMSQPEEMFDIFYFRNDPRPFFSFAKELFPGNFKPSPSHFFIKLLERHGQLLRNYTQNIDTLETVAGIERVVQCHGSFKTASCQRCKYKVDGEAIRADVFAQRVPYCPKCTASRQDDDDDDDDGQTVDPVLKPDIVFFGEKLSTEFDDAIERDHSDVDLLIVIGTSLQVHPVAGIMDFVPEHVPQILINREPIGHMEFDVELLGNCDEIIGELSERLGWLSELEQLLGRPFSRADRQRAAQPKSTTVDAEIDEEAVVVHATGADVDEPVEGIDSAAHAERAKPVQELLELKGDHVFVFHPPNRYLFDGAKVDDSDSEPDNDGGGEDDSSPGDDGHNQHEGEDYDDDGDDDGGDAANADLVAVRFAKQKVDRIGHLNRRVTQLHWAQHHAAEPFHFADAANDAASVSDDGDAAD